MEEALQKLKDLKLRRHSGESSECEELDVGKNEPDKTEATNERGQKTEE